MGLPVSDALDAPAGARIHHLPKQQAALFNLNNHSPLYRTAMLDYIYGCWLPNSPYQRAEGEDFEMFQSLDFLNQKAGNHSIYAVPIRSKTSHF